jgi:hypothetical protein
MLPIITEKISSGGEVSIPITGKSMYPTLKQGRDYAVLKKAPEHLEKGDIPFYRRENGCFVLHRVVGEDENGLDMYLFYKRTRDLNREEMSRLIEGTVSEAQALKIETITPDELARMMNRYGGKE